jgi:DNA-binding cell septation regulator SpoVG
MKISDWKAFEKNTLRGFFTVTLDSGLVIHKCSLHEKNGSRWVGLPAEKYKKQDGTTAYSVLIEFRSREVSDRFRKQVLLALEAQGLA